MALVLRRPLRSVTVGVNVHAMRDDVTSAQMVAQLQQIKTAGGGLVRTQVGWASFEEQGKGQWNTDRLAKLELFISTCEGLGLKKLLMLADTPAWATSAPGGAAAASFEKYPPASVTNFADALVYLAARYAGRVEAWEMWNEPNLDFFWRGLGSDHARAVAYAALVRATYVRAKAADPAAKFIAGALSETHPAFLADLYSQGILGYYDALSVHPYCHDRSPLDLRTSQQDYYPEVSFAGGVPLIRAAQQAAGDPSPLWLTEFGWSTTATRGNPNPGLNGVDEATQAIYLAQAIGKVRDWPYVPAVVYYDLRETGGSDLLSNFGITHSDGSAKPALASLST